MSIKNYDATVDYIENNITLEKETLSNTAERILNIGGRKAGEFFSYIEPEKRTIKKYIRDRKLFCALQEFISGCTAEEIVEKYGISDASRFSSDVNLLIGKYPSVLRKEKYTIPRVQHLCDILGMDYQTGHTPADMSLDEKEKYISEIRRLIDENYELREDITRMRIREIDRTQSDSAPIKKEDYQQFLMVEECRRTYGFDIDQILRLYKESLTSDKSLESLCEEALFSFRFEYEQELEYEAIDEIEAIQYQNAYEMNSQEAWDYYIGDDSLDELEDDPYADEEEYVGTLDDVCPDNYEEYYAIDKVLEEQRLEEELNAIEELINLGVLPDNEKKSSSIEQSSNEIGDDDIPF